MDNRIIQLILALGRLNSQPGRHSLIGGFNSSETGVFWAITNIHAERPGVELISLSDLNSYLQFTRPNLSQTINKLEDKGYVERVILKDDRRVTYIKLTPSGAEAVKNKFDEIFSRMQKISEMMGEEDTDKFIDLSLRFADAYKKTEQ